MIDAGQAGHRAAVVPTIDAGKLTAGKPVIVPPVVPTIDAGQAGHRAGPWCRRSTPGKLVIGRPWCRRVAVIDLATCRGPRGADVPPVVPRASTPASRSSTWQAPGPPRGRARADDRRGLAGKAGHRAARGADVPRVIDLATCRARGADDRRREACRAGQAGHRPGKRRGLPAAVPVPTIDGGQLGKLVIDLATCRRSPVVPTIDAGKRADGGQAGHRPGNVPRSPVVPTIDAGKRAEAGQAGHRPGKRRGLPAAVPVVPMIDAGQFQGQADGGQAGHRPGKRRGLPAAVPVADDRRREACRAGQAGHRPGKRRGLPAAVPVPMIDAGVPRAMPTPGSVPSGKAVIDLATGPPRGRARGADHRRREAGADVPSRAGRADHRPCRGPALRREAGARGAMPIIQGHALASWCRSSTLPEAVPSSSTPIIVTAGRSCPSV